MVEPAGIGISLGSVFVEMKEDGTELEAIERLTCCTGMGFWFAVEDGTPIAANIGASGVELDADGEGRASFNTPER